MNLGKYNPNSYQDIEHSHHARKFPQENSLFPLNPHFCSPYATTVTNFFYHKLVLPVLELFINGINHIKCSLWDKASLTQHNDFMLPK